MGNSSPKHLRMGTARLKQDNETEEEGKKMRMNMERSTADTEKKEVLSTGIYRYEGQSRYESWSRYSPRKRLGTLN